jgi:hypothetical protein
VQLGVRTPSPTQPALLIQLKDLDGNETHTVSCPGPTPTALKTDWRSPWKNPNLSKPIAFTVLGVTPRTAQPIDVDFVQADQAVTLTRILCWPTPTTCSSV